MTRLFANRDNYKTIHIHLDNNGGGDLVPVHLILRCLCGKKEKWMKRRSRNRTQKRKHSLNSATIRQLFS